MCCYSRPWRQGAVLGGTALNSLMKLARLRVQVRGGMSSYILL